MVSQKCKLPNGVSYITKSLAMSDLVYVLLHGSINFFLLLANLNIERMYKKS